MRPQCVTHLAGMWLIEKCVAAAPSLPRGPQTFQSQIHLGVLTEPGFKAVEAELVRFVELHQKVISPNVVKFQAVPINAQECGADSDGGALVAVNKRMILRKAFEQGGGLPDEVPVVASARPSEGRFKGSEIADALCASK